MKKNFLMLLLGVALLMPATMMAQSGTRNEDNPNKHRSPACSSYAYISYDELAGVVIVSFRADVSDAEVIVIQNGNEVDCLTINATEGTQIPVYLPVYGTGEFTIQVKSGSTLLAVYDTTL